MVAGVVVPAGTLMVRVVRRITLPVAGSKSSVTSVCGWVAGAVVVVDLVVLVVAGLVWATAAKGSVRPKAARRREFFMGYKEINQAFNGKRQPNGVRRQCG